MLGRLFFSLNENALITRRELFNSEENVALRGQEGLHLLGTLKTGGTGEIVVHGVGRGSKKAPRQFGRLRKFSICNALGVFAFSVARRYACKAGVLPLNYPPLGVPATRGIVYKEFC